MCNSLVGINRYIMECKYAFAATNDAGGEN